MARLGKIIAIIGLISCITWFILVLTNGYANPLLLLIGFPIIILGSNIYDFAKIRRWFKKKQGE